MMQPARFASGLTSQLVCFYSDEEATEEGCKSDQSCSNLLRQRSLHSGLLHGLGAKLEIGSSYSCDVAGERGVNLQYSIFGGFVDMRGSSCPTLAELGRIRRGSSQE